MIDRLKNQAMELIHSFFRALVEFIDKYELEGDKKTNLYVLIYDHKPAIQLAKKKCSPEGLKLIDKAIKKHKKEVKEHFKTNKWPLDLSVIRSEILESLFGFKFDSYLIAKLIDRLEIRAAFNPKTLQLYLVPKDYNNEKA